MECNQKMHICFHFRIELFIIIISSRPPKELTQSVNLSFVRKYSFENQSYFNNKYGYILFCCDADTTANFNTQPLYLLNKSIDACYEAYVIKKFSDLEEAKKYCFLYFQELFNLLFLFSDLFWEWQKIFNVSKYSVIHLYAQQIIFSKQKCTNFFVIKCFDKEQ